MIGNAVWHRPAPGEVYVFHHATAGDILCLYLFRRPEGAHVIMTLDRGELVDVGGLREGQQHGCFELFR